MFWSLMWSSEQNRATMQPALQNFLYTAADFSHQNGLPGFVSASSIPEGDYEGKAGIPSAAETSDKLVFNIASVYALASAYSLDPTLVTTWIQAIQNQYPELTKRFGFVDSLRSGTEFSDVVNAIDQGSSILGFLGTGGQFMDVYLANRGLKTDYEALYNSVNLGIAPIELDPQGPPAEFPSRSLSVLNHISAEGSLGQTPVSQTSRFGTAIQYSFSGGEIPDLAGHFWELDQPYDVRLNDVVFSYSGTAIPSRVSVELKDEFGNVIGFPKTFVLETESGIHTDGTITLQPLAELPQLARVKFINLVINPQTTGANADFFVHQITFKQTPTQAAILAAILASSQAPPASRDFTSILNFRLLQLQAKNRRAVATVELSDRERFSFERLVFGFKSNREIEEIELELETEEGERATGYVTNI